MSWGINAIGKPPAVAAKLATEFSVHPCIEPEEGVRQAAAVVIAAVLAVQDPSSAVRVEAGGCQSTNYDSKGQPTGTFQNTLNIKIEPIYGFVE
jgi:hypothetical protein